MTEATRLPIPESAEPGIQPGTVAELQIRELAYEIFLSRGCSDGHDLDDWYAAERELRARLPQRARRSSGLEQNEG